MTLSIAMRTGVRCNKPVRWQRRAAALEENNGAWTAHGLLWVVLLGRLGFPQSSLLGSVLVGFQELSRQLIASPPNDDLSLPIGSLFCCLENELYCVHAFSIRLLTGAPPPS